MQESPDSSPELPQKNMAMKEEKDKDKIELANLELEELELEKNVSEHSGQSDDEGETVIQQNKLFKLKKK